jgi:hypothetical protein
VSCDVRTVVRFDPESVVGRPIAEASEHFVVLAAGTHLWYGTMNAGEVHVISEAGTRRIATGQAVPVEMVAHGERVAWLNRDSPGGATIAVATSEDLLSSLVAGSGAWNLTIDAEYVYWMRGGWNSGTELWRAKLGSGAGERLASVPEIGPSMATPRWIASQGELLVTSKDEVLVVHRAARATRLCRSPGPLRAIAANTTTIALLVGEDDRPWLLATLPRSGGVPRIIASFQRAPYHRHALVLSRGHACIPIGDRIYAAPID